MPAPSIGIIAGEGALPVSLARHVAGQGILPVIIGISPDTDPYLAGHFPFLPARPGQVGRVFRFLKQHGVHDIVMIGRMKRPAPWTIWPDFTGFKALLCVLPAFAGGDDTLLRAVKSFLNRHGFAVRGIHEYLPGLLAKKGAWGRVEAPAGMLEGIRIGMQAAHKLGSRDIGQAVVVQNETVIATEDQSGTDNLITRCRGRTGAVLVKAAKPQQDRDFDLPTVGPSTVALCRDAGFAGIAVEHGLVIVSDYSKMVELADDAGIFLVGVNGDEHP